MCAAFVELAVENAAQGGHEAQISELDRGWRIVHLASGDGEEEPDLD